MKYTGIAYCPIGGEKVEGSLSFEHGVRLQRNCETHGVCNDLLYSSEDYFKKCLISSSSKEEQAERCLVVEITDRCDVGCATCSAASGDNGQDEPVLTLVADIHAAVKKCGANVVALSGGEPLMRDDIWIIADLVKQFVDRVVLITIGRGFETESIIMQQIADRSEWLELYLQFDSLNESTLSLIRTPAITSGLRRERLRLAVQTGATVSAVCVVSDFTEDDEIRKITDYLITTGAGGVTFQPLRKLGRFPVKKSGREHLRTVDGIQGVALSTVFDQKEPLPFSGQPFDMSVSWSSGTRASNFFLERPSRADFRIATSSYWDLNNYFSPLAEGNRAFFLFREKGRGVRMLNRHYFDQSIEAMSEKYNLRPTA